MGRQVLARYDTNTFEDENGNRDSETSPSRNCMNQNRGFWFTAKRYAELPFWQA